MALWLVAALVASAASAQQTTADQLIAEQREALRGALRIDCPPGADEAEIVVCGWRDRGSRQHRLPPVATRPGAADRAGGEQRAALANATDTCTPVGRDQQCNGGLDLIGIGFTIARALAQALVNDD
jgi:hypothetical protein